MLHSNLLPRAGHPPNFPAGTSPEPSLPPLLVSTEAEFQRWLPAYVATREPELRVRLVRAGDRLVRTLVSRFRSSRAAAAEDLLQVGYLGLLRALDRYDPGKGESFVRFAVPTILGDLRRYFRDQTWGVRAPRRLQLLAQVVHGSRADLTQRLGREPTPAEIAAAVGSSEDAVREAMELPYLHHLSSLDAPCPGAWEDDARFIADGVGGTDPEFAAVEDRVAIDAALVHLEPRLRRLIRRRFFDNATQAMVAQELGVSQMHVSRLEHRALDQLRCLLS